VVLLTSMIQARLQPFPGSHAPSLKFTGSVTRQAQILQIQMHVLSDRSLIRIPDAQAIPQRQHELWTTTCFEFFLGVPSESRYWEFNYSPSGDWNCYAFDDYRQGMREEAAVPLLRGRWTRQAEALSLDLEFDLSLLGLEAKPLELSLTAVIETQGGEISYWAIAHCGKQADFHRRENFSLMQST
jgi:hypothetical protein